MPAREELAMAADLDAEFMQQEIRDELGI